MTEFFAKIFSRYPIKTRRVLEFLPGSVSWSLILFPVWGSFIIPWAVAYFILFFDVYWFYKSFSLATTAFVASRKIKAAEKENWLERAKPLENFEKVTHVLVIPNYKENLEKLRRTIESLRLQTFPAKRIYIVLAMEKREIEANARANTLIKEFKDKFGGIFATYHPDIAGEVKGKSSNEAFGGKAAYKRLVKTGIIDFAFATISSVDADSIFDKQYLSYLSFGFLTDPERYTKFWQSAPTWKETTSSMPPA